MAALSFALLLALPHLLVLGAGKPPASRAFVDGLRIQLANTAVVDTSTDPIEGTLPQKVEQALARGEASGAVLTVWVEEGTSDSGETDFVLYAVGRQGARALVEIVRLPASGGADVHRALALKLAGVLEAMLAARPSAPDLTQPVVAPPPPLAPPRTTDTSILIEVGAFGAGEGSGNAGAQAGLSLAAGARLRHSAWSLEAYGRARLLSDLDVTGMGGRMTAREWALAGGAAILHGGRIGLGGALELGARLLDATGTAGDGRVGTLSRQVPMLTPLVEARASLAESLQLRAAAGIEIDLRHQTFVAAGAPVADLGWVRPMGEISLVVSIR